MEEYIPALLILMSGIAFVAYMVHQRWFDRHPWPGSTREELDRILKRNREELVKKERDEQAKNSKLDGPAEKKNAADAQGNVTKVIQVRGLSMQIHSSANEDQQSKGSHTSPFWKP
jgi:Skp family chaperone for outer membrane proteins